MPKLRSEGRGSLAKQGGLVCHDLTVFSRRKYDTCARMLLTQQRRVPTGMTLSCLPAIASYICREMSGSVQNETGNLAAEVCAAGVPPEVSVMVLSAARIFAGRLEPPQLDAGVGAQRSSLDGVLSCVFL